MCHEGSHSSRSEKFRVICLVGKKNKKKTEKVSFNSPVWRALSGTRWSSVWKNPGYGHRGVELDLCVAGEAPKHPCCWFIIIYSLHACLEWFFIHILTEYLNKITWKQLKKNNLVQLVINKQPDFDVKQEESWRDSGGRRENFVSCWFLWSFFRNIDSALRRASATDVSRWSLCLNVLEGIALLMYFMSSLAPLITLDFVLMNEEFIFISRVWNSQKANSYKVYAGHEADARVSPAFCTGSISRWFPKKRGWPGVCITGITRQLGTEGRLHVLSQPWALQLFLLIPHSQQLLCVCLQWSCRTVSLWGHGAGLELIGDKEPELYRFSFCWLTCISWLELWPSDTWHVVLFPWTRDVWIRWSLLM